MCSFYQANAYSDSQCIQVITSLTSLISGTPAPRLINVSSSPITTIIVKLIQENEANRQFSHLARIHSGVKRRGGRSTAAAFTDPKLYTQALRECILKQSRTCKSQLYLVWEQGKYRSRGN